MKFSCFLQTNLSSVLITSYVNDYKQETGITSQQLFIIPYLIIFHNYKTTLCYFMSIWTMYGKNIFRLAAIIQCFVKSSELQVFSIQYKENSVCAYHGWGEHLLLLNGDQSDFSVELYNY